MDYSALIVDVIGSREYLKSDLASKSYKRQEIQNFLMFCVDLLNDSFNNSIEKRLVFSGGDEIQGLFYDPSSAFLCYRMLTLLAHPVKLRGGIGIGAWNVQMDEDGSAAQDGLVYYGARKAIEDAKKAKAHLLIFHEKDKATRQMNAAINASIEFCAQRTVAQNEVALLADLLCPISRELWNRANDYHELLDKRYAYNLIIQGKQGIDQDAKNYSKDFFDSARDRINYYNHYDHNDDFQNYYINEGRIPNLATALSPILKKTRQGLEKVIKKANVTIERNLTIANLELMSGSHDAPRLQS